MQESEILSPRRIKNNQSGEPQEPKNYLVELFKLFLPPFIVTIIVFLSNLTKKIVVFAVSLLWTNGQKPGEASAQFRKRIYERNIESLKLKQQDLGFTNQVLYAQNKKAINFFLPVYVTNKIKSIQDVSVQSLTGNISCALIINVFFGDIPEEIVKKLQDSIVVQLNRGESMFLADDGITITVKRDKKARFLIFTIRKVFLGFLIQDTLWSPFQLLQLVISLTLNTVTIQPNSLEVLQPQTGYNASKQYKISFNCMRNSDLMPMSFALDCVYGVYDLAQRKMQSYHTNLGTYKQIIRKYEELINSKKINGDKKLKKAVKKDNEKIKSKQQKQKAQKLKKESQKKQELKKQQSDPLASLLFVKKIAENTMKRLSMRAIPNEQKTPAKKVKYFQYTHFIIPLYKYPGNSLITIFLPIFMLALLSLAIFFQDSQLSGRIGAIATMILGYIALIPSIKQQLPPSAKLTVIEFLVYVQALCCMLCLYQSFIIRNLEDYQFLWSQNINFLLCLFIHSFIFIIVIGLYLIHKLKWQPEYNCDQKVPEIKPAESPQSWDNPFCDQVFIKYNQEVMQQQIGPERDQMLIKPYKNPVAEKKPQKSKKTANNGPASLTDLLKEDLGQEMLSSDVKPLEMPGSGILDWLKIQPTSPRSMSQFVVPDEKLYYQNKQ